MKKLLALFLTAAFLTAALTSCNTDDTNTGNENTTAADGCNPPANNGDNGNTETPPANGDADSRFVGAWGCPLPHTHNFLCDISFSEDGRFIDGDGDEGDYTVVGNTVKLSFDALEIADEISVDFVSDGSNGLDFFHQNIPVATLVRNGTPNPENNRATSADQVVGTWTSDTSEWFSNLTFTEDGRFVDADGDEGTFTINNGEITFNFDGYPTQEGYLSIYGEKLIYNSVVLERA
jgi:hypothetical protein